MLKTDGQSMALLDVGTHRNLQALVLTVKRLKGVSYAELNYLYQATVPVGGDGAGPQVNQPMAAGQAPLPPNYPNDPYVLLNVGWRMTMADIVWANTSPSKTVCLLDSGVDYLHPDLKGKIIKGPDYVSDDLDPMDDFGGGTHLAAIIAAVANNNEGIVGISTGKVLAVKVLDSYGKGTAFDVARGITYCADQTSVSVILVTWTGVSSMTLQAAVSHAVGTGTTQKHKLLVAAAGDHDPGTDDPYSNYPAAYSPLFAGIAAVAASGLEVNGNVDYTCRKDDSDYGPWGNLVAPGTQIFSTFPYNKHSGYLPNYGDLDGTAQAAAYVAAAAARVWGYLPQYTAEDVKNRLRDTGMDLYSNNGSCWPASMATPIRFINLAKAMDRGALIVTVKDATTNLPIPGAKVSVYSPTNALVGSAVVPSTPVTDPITGQLIPYPYYVYVLNLPVGNPSTLYTAKVSATNYTASPQNAFVVVGYTNTMADGKFSVITGTFIGGILARIPPKSANFAVIGQSTDAGHPPVLAVWVPKPPNSPANFIVSWKYYIHDPLSLVLPYGSMTTDPYARWMRYDADFFESILIHNRPTDAAAPWYTGSYLVGMTDTNTSDTNYLDATNVSVLVWKDGVIKKRVDKGASFCGPDLHWWFPLQINSPASGAATYTTPAVVCGINSPGNPGNGAPY